MTTRQTFFFFKKLDIMNKKGGSKTHVYPFLGVFAHLDLSLLHPGALDVAFLTEQAGKRFYENSKN